MESCIFCKIVKGDIPSTKIYEDEEFLAFMDIYPVSLGHVLLIPKNHLRWMQDAEDHTVGKIFILAKNLINQMKNGLACDYVQLSVVGEEVEHFHIHLIPRYFKDGLAKWATISYESDEQVLQYANKITS